MPILFLQVYPRGCAPPATIHFFAYQDSQILKDYLRQQHIDERCYRLLSPKQMASLANELLEGKPQPTGCRFYAININK